jgi:non-homologous end joining protein Ku
MGGVPIIGDVVETVTETVAPKKRTTETRAAETAKKTEPEAKRDVTRTLRRAASRTRRAGRSLVGGRLVADAAGKDLSPVRNPRDQSTLGA